MAGAWLLAAGRLPLCFRFLRLPLVLLAHTPTLTFLPPDLFAILQLCAGRRPTASRPRPCLSPATTALSGPSARPPPTLPQPRTAPRTTATVAERAGLCTRGGTQAAMTLSLAPPAMRARPLLTLPRRCVCACVWTCARKLVLVSCCP